MRLVYKYMAIFFTFSPTSSHLHPLQVENCGSNSRLEVGEDDNVKSGLKGPLRYLKYIICKVILTGFAVLTMTFESYISSSYSGKLSHVHIINIEAGHKIRRSERPRQLILPSDNPVLISRFPSDNQLKIDRDFQK